ncbi:glycoside hydrolase family 5 protein [Babjeviella inositovora NRRL Y-12698]|uniref:Glucan 1,3-beta-glucosidase n=1 Tax=Babjeviella inositovora NRRL Y-12698 TaxID=984486 RepID=A0A1E3QWV5_9ASCO|nr:glycoside hydrolase family 5 protein [Babjeviella inositovora NRRL Y-12698]ODQ82121.1 glycoside hydrolase family 5 protein [Babjeviella inositovora NRRL Y-12698]
MTSKGLIVTGLLFGFLECVLSQSLKVSLPGGLSEKIQGVALGGWLVLEPYITPSLFTVFENATATNTTENVPVDEYTYCQVLGKDECASRLETHWSTFYNETDFQQIKQMGLNLVRIPVGYWAFALLSGDPYVQGQEKYLDQAIEWSRQNDLKVWIDLHGVPGSQNGFDNSGKRGGVDWLKNRTYISTTYGVLDYIFGKYGQANYSDTIVGIELVNEPLGPLLNMTEVENIYYNSYQSAKAKYHVQDTIVLQDAFQWIGYWDSFLSNETSPAVMIDHHHYEVFTVDQLKASIGVHVSNINSFGNSIVQHLANHSAVVGEWSAALTDCVRWLNGVNMGARYDGTFQNDEVIGTCDNITDWKKWTKDQKRHTREFVEVQLDAYNQTSGWIFWCWKTEDTIEWDFKRLVALDLMPQPLSARKYTMDGVISGGLKLGLGWKVYCFMGLLLGLTIGF